jgi:hypothetical protein
MWPGRRTFEAACLGGIFFAKNNAEVAVAPLTPDGGSKTARLNLALRIKGFARLIVARGSLIGMTAWMSFPQPASLGALALALAGVGVLTGTVLVVGLIALPSGKPSSVLSTPNAGLGSAIYRAV